LEPELPDDFIENQKLTFWPFQIASGFNIFVLVFGPVGFIWVS
jgi:hypothetical protein